MRTVSRGNDEIEEICDKTEENVHVSSDDIYREIDFYDETAEWSTLQGLPKMLDAHGPKGVVMNIYGEALCDDIFDRKCNGN